MTNKQNIAIVGLGGIGSQLCEPICRFIYHLSNMNDYIITLVDGDEYDSGNQSRQNISIENIGENKAKSQYKKLKKLFPELEINLNAIYINSGNMHKCFSDGDIILLGVDNHKTRKLTQDFCCDMDNILLVSGGNNYIDGDVLVYAKKNGVALTPTIYQYNKDILNYTDRSPEDIGCDELIPSDPQLIFTNGMVSICIQMVFYNYYKMFNNDDNIFPDTMVNDIMFDIKEIRVIPRIRKI